MKLVPVDFPFRPGGGVEFGFVVRHKHTQGHQVEFSIGADLMRKMNWRDGSLVRLDADVKERVAAFVNVVSEGPLTRKVRMTKASTKRGKIIVPYNGPVRDLFTDVSSMTTLGVIKCTSEHLCFNLPSPAEAEQ